MRPNSDQAATVQVREYLANLAPPARRHLLKVREAVRAAAPGAVDAFSYKIPAIRKDGRIVVWYAGWKKHSSLYPITLSMQTSFAAAIERYETSKGTIRFPHDAPPPASLIKRLVKARLADMKKSVRVSTPKAK